ncbi:hypothetical protein L226DRAFT_577136 [Lentinus tigrinus ALCF2SS1-7]|uniref:uncharacterized protein n=1 Tax=Lentinus tigrinus ALCF2SS1-7 TaxID=1328758 RepID=UPI001165D680|nr:hypothetical protein L226DRAFT_577136 [Lentinus tigrinus ALCF2SS1-7]
MWSEGHTLRDAFVTTARVNLGQDRTNLLAVDCYATISHGTDVVTSERMKPFQTAMQTHGRNVPVAVMVDTHATPEGLVTFHVSKAVFKRLQISSVNGVDAAAIPLPEFLDMYLGNFYRSGLNHLTAVKGLFLLACGPVLTAPGALAHVQALVTQRKFDFVMGFSAAGIIPEDVHTSVLAVYRELIIRQADQPTLWDVFLKAYTPVSVQSSTASIFTFIEGDNVTSRMVMYNHLSSRTFGLTIRCPSRCDQQFNQAFPRQAALVGAQDKI